MRLTWSKTAQVDSVSQIYKLYDEGEPSLKVCIFLEEYTSYLSHYGLRMTPGAFCLPVFTFNALQGMLK